MMDNNATLYLLCGKMAAGKSTHAEHLSKLVGATVLSEDALLSSLYPGEISDIPSYIKFSGRLKFAIEGVVITLLSSGTSLILDFPGNTVEQRSWLLGLAQQANSQHELHFLDTPESICKVQLERRAIEQPDRAATDTIEMFNAMSQYFQCPSEEEGLNVIIVKR